MTSNRNRVNEESKQQQPQATAQPFSNAVDDRSSSRRKLGSTVENARFSDLHKLQTTPQYKSRNHAADVASGESSGSPNPFRGTFKHLAESQQNLRSS